MLTIPLLATFLLTNVLHPQASAFKHVPTSAPSGAITISACYFSAECTYTQALGFYGPVDGPAFEFTNATSGMITAATFTILGNKRNGVHKDTYAIGDIGPSQSAVVIPGASNDGKKRRSSSLFFYYAGSPRDTSDVGPSADSIKFSFQGLLDGTPINSGKIVTGATAGPSTDGTVAYINFLGGPGNADAPCGDCFAPKVIATIYTARHAYR